MASGLATFGSESLRRDAVSRQSRRGSSNSGSTWLVMSPIRSFLLSVVSQRSRVRFITIMASFPCVWLRFHRSIHTGTAGSSGSFGTSADFSDLMIVSLSSSGVPSLQAHASTNLNVSLFHTLLMSSSRIGTNAIIMTGNAGAPLVKVTMKITAVTTICRTVYAWTGQ